MNKKQIAALKSLSKAFKKCKKANLAFQGMDCSLIAFDSDEYDKLTVKYSIGEQQYIKNGSQGESVITHNTYRDSGGW